MDECSINQPLPRVVDFWLSPQVLPRSCLLCGWAIFCWRLCLEAPGLRWVRSTQKHKPFSKTLRPLKPKDLARCDGSSEKSVVCCARISAHIAECLIPHSWIGCWVLNETWDVGVVRADVGCLQGKVLITLIPLLAVAFPHQWWRNWCCFVSFRPLSIWERYRCETCAKPAFQPGTDSCWIRGKICCDSERDGFLNRISFFSAAFVCQLGASEEQIFRL